MKRLGHLSRDARVARRRRCPDISPTLADAFGDFENCHSTSFNSDERAMLKPIGSSRGVSEWYFDPEK
jgi:hypothetical protein